MRRPRRSAALALGLAGLAACAGLPPMDVGDIPLLQPGLPVTGASGEYAFTPRTLFWRSIPPGSISDEQADLELIGGDTLAAVWVVVHVQPRAAVSLDDVLNQRRELIFSEWKVASYEEERRFFDQEDFTILARSHFATRGGYAQAPEKLTVMTLATERSVIEIVGFAPSIPTLDRELASLLGSLELRAPQTGAP